MAEQPLLARAAGQAQVIEFKFVALLPVDKMIIRRKNSLQKA